MILIKYLHIGIDDTDSPDGMCTTYLACHIIDKLKEVGIEIVGCPRLIRLNPFARFKTRGNGGVAFKILNNDKIKDSLGTIPVIKSWELKEFENPSELLKIIRERKDNL